MPYQSVKINCSSDYTDILTAELSELGFVSFQENESGGFSAYMPENSLIPRDALEECINRYKQLDAGLSFQYEEIEKENWNQSWEDNYDPIEVDDEILIKASFHTAEKSYPYVIEINPKMSFGTGHHETTFLMLKFLSKMDLSASRVLDAGCGTGILGIYAAMRNAESISAYDIDEWAVENSRENFVLNDIDNKRYQLWQGDVLTLGEDDRYDVVIANINKNILLNDISSFASRLNKNSKLLLSGFYEADIKDITQECETNGLKFIDKKIKNQWAALSFQTDH